MQTLTESDLHFLRQAIAVSHRARAAGNHPFGALLVDANGALLMENENDVTRSGDCTAHAELGLVRRASPMFSREVLLGCTLYSSCEPCAMCSGSIHWGNIGRLVYALSETRLYSMTGAHPENSTMELPCRDVFAHCTRPVTVLGPAFEDEAALAHAGFWT